MAFGIGTNGSRSTVIGGTALFMAADKVIAKGKMLAAHLLEAGEADIDFADGNFTIKGTDKSVSLKEVAKAAFNSTKWPKNGIERGLYENATFKRREGHLSQRLPHLRGRGRSGDRRGRRWIATPWSTMSAR